MHDGSADPPGGSGRADAPALPRADFITGVVLSVIGLGAFVVSLDMPRFEERNVNPYTVPGLVPGALALVLVLLGGLLAGRAIRAGAWRTRRASAAPAAPDLRQIGLTLALTLGYAGVLVGRLPFWLATFLFVFAFVVVFEWRDRGAGRARRIAFATVYAAGLAALVTYVFQEVFLVRLP